MVDVRSTREGHFLPTLRVFSLGERAPPAVLHVY